MTTYLITGAQGFLGRYLVAHLLEHEPDCRIVGLGRSPRNDESFTHQILLGQQNTPAPLTDALRAVAGDERYSYVQADLSQMAQMVGTLRDVRPGVIFHLASALRDDPVDILFQTNVVGSVRLLEAVAAAQLGDPKVVLASSGGVYGIPLPDSLPLDEQAVCRPNDYYSISKLSSEQATALIAKHSRIPTVTGRIFNVVGPGQDERHVCGRIISQLAAIGSGATSAVRIGALETTRDFIDVRDVAAALACLSRHGAKGETYNVASGQETSIQQVLDLSLDVADLADRVEVHHLPGRPADIPRHFGSNERLGQLGFELQYSLRQSLADILGYYRGCWAQAEEQAAAKTSPESS
ncbi:MAG: NAD-dependent epimerase/dehydratase family protein [Planctomycetota bacterium]|nr:MAG: NAD-dependent epimerase/dehydratase family protein [Planctomycetota bacterium]